MRDPQLLVKIRAGEEITLLAEGQLLIQPVWNREIGACIAHIADNANTQGVGGEIFNMAGPDAITTRRYYEIIADYLDVPLRFQSLPLSEFIHRSPDQAHMARHRQYDLSHLAQATGYRPQFAIEDALRETARRLDGQS